LTVTINGTNDVPVIGGVKDRHGRTEDVGVRCRSRHDQRHADHHRLSIRTSSGFVAPGRDGGQQWVRRLQTWIRAGHWTYAANDAQAAIQTAPASARR